MQLEFDFDPIPSIKKLFYMTSGLFTNELCYTYKTSYGNATGYSREQAMSHLLRLGYSKENANALLIHAKRSQKWVVYQYQQNLGF